MVADGCGSTLLIASDRHGGPHGPSFNVRYPAAMRGQPHLAPNKSLHDPSGHCWQLSRCTQIAESDCEVRETALKARIFRASLYSNRGQRAEGRTRPPSPTDVSYAFKSPTNFIAHFVRDLTTNIKYPRFQCNDFAVKTRTILKTKDGQSAI